MLDFRLKTDINPRSNFLREERYPSSGCHNLATDWKIGRLKIIRLWHQKKMHLNSAILAQKCTSSSSCPKKRTLLYQGPMLLLHSGLERCEKIVLKKMYLLPKLLSHENRELLFLKFYKAKFYYIE